MLRRLVVDVFPRDPFCNIFPMFSHFFPLALLDVVLAKLQNRNGFVATWRAERRPCPRNHTVRNVWRAPFRDTLSGVDSVFQICNDSYNFGDICPPDHSVRNVWRVSPFDSGALLGQQLGHVNRQDRPSARERCPVVAGSVPVGGRLGCQRRPGLPRGTYVGTPAATAWPPVGYPPRPAAPCTCSCLTT